MKLTKLALLCSMSALVASVEDLEVDGRNDILDAQAASFLDITNNFVSDKPEVSQAVALAQLVSAPANSGAAAARQTQEVWNGLTIEGRPAISFTTLGNGDCFFYCLGVTRKEVEARLRVRIALLPEGHPHKQLLITYLREELRKKDIKQSNIFEAREASFEPNVFDFEYEADPCDIGFLALVFEIQLEIYNKSEDGNHLQLVKVGLFNENANLPVLRLLQSGGYNGGHFDLLAVPGTPEFEEMQARGHALKDISTFTRPGEEGRQALEERLRQEDWLWRHHQTSLNDKERLLYAAEQERMTQFQNAVLAKSVLYAEVLEEAQESYKAFQEVLKKQRIQESFMARLSWVVTSEEADRLGFERQVFDEMMTHNMLGKEAIEEARQNEERIKALRAREEAALKELRELQERRQAELEAQQKAEQEAKDATFALALANGPDTSGDEELARLLSQGQPQAAQPAASKPIPKGGRRLGGEVSEEEARGRLACAAERRDLRAQQEARDATLALELARQLEGQVLDDQPQAAQSAVSEAAKVTRREAHKEELRKKREAELAAEKQRAEEAQREREARAATAKKKPGGNDRNPKLAWRQKY